MTLPLVLVYVNTRLHHLLFRWLKADGDYASVLSVEYSAEFEPIHLLK